MVNKLKKREGNVMEMFCLQLICVSRKRPGPHHGGNRKFWRGRGLKGLGNFSGVRGLKTKINFQRTHTVQYNDCFSPTKSHPLLWVALVLPLVMLHFSYHALAQNNFFNTSCFKAN